MAEMLREAADEMTAAAEYYEDRRTGMGHRFINRVQLAVARVEAMPRIGAPSSSRYPEVRRYAVRGFPYYVVYATEPVITVIAVAHTKRRPGYWLDRLPH
jgi:plasmid stabilization system protein ParE